MPTPVPQLPTRLDWPRLLTELTAQVVTGRIYDRDLADVSLALTAANEALARRLAIRDRTARRRF